MQAPAPGKPAAEFSKEADDYFILSSHALRICSALAIADRTVIPQPALQGTSIALATKPPSPESSFTSKSGVLSESYCICIFRTSHRVNTYDLHILL